MRQGPTVMVQEGWSGRTLNEQYTSLPFPVVPDCPSHFPTFPLLDSDYECMLPNTRHPWCYWRETV
ncbi:hypothetical protein GCM10007108_00550 [Thermogymnomonas acidicola]|uniref:Uncharacterized protein n=1 Tax=Thermogymnomonas acidicola TaxID=399579 RepID=A0AA37BPQ0_9ARCH|nr:hypothetical protein GCM10007108_00550 [Thermogymnomonas acidicola]